MNRINQDGSVNVIRYAKFESHRYVFRLGKYLDMNVISVVDKKEIVHFTHAIALFAEPQEVCFDDDFIRVKSGNDFGLYEIRDGHMNLLAIIRTEFGVISTRAKVTCTTDDCNFNQEFCKLLAMKINKLVYSTIE